MGGGGCYEKQILVRFSSSDVRRRRIAQKQLKAAEGKKKMIEKRKEEVGILEWGEGRGRK